MTLNNIMMGFIITDEYISYTGDTLSTNIPPDVFSILKLDFCLYLQWKASIHTEIRSDMEC